MRLVQGLRCVLLRSSRIFCKFYSSLGVFFGCSSSFVFFSFGLTFCAFLHFPAPFFPAGLPPLVGLWALSGTLFPRFWGVFLLFLFFFLLGPIRTLSVLVTHLVSGVFGFSLWCGAHPFLGLLYSCLTFFASVFSRVFSSKPASPGWAVGFVCFSRFSRAFGFFLLLVCWVFILLGWTLFGVAFFSFLVCFCYKLFWAVFSSFWVSLWV